MPKKLLKQYLPTPDKVKQHKCIRIFGHVLHEPNLWHLNRHSVLRGVNIGLFVAFLPIPFQMACAAIIAIFARANLAISVTLVWITNPITMAPIFYFAYRIGSQLLGQSGHHFQFELSFEWFLKNIESTWQPLLLGSFLLATLAMLCGNLIVRILWRRWVLHHWHLRQSLRTRARGSKHPIS